MLRNSRHNSQIKRAVDSPPSEERAAMVVCRSRDETVKSDFDFHEQVSE